MRPAREPASLRGWVTRWWRGEAGGVGRAVDVALAPGEALFRSVVAMRSVGYQQGVLRSRSAPIPVVSIGNLTVGGAGKTPVAAWTADRLRVSGRRPAIVLRGYGADEAEVHRELNPDVPVHISRDRWAGAVQAAAEGADCVVLDDGFQHRALNRDFDIVLLSADHWTGNRRMLPRGPWREPLSALGRADHILVTRKLASPEDAARIVAEIADRGLPEPTVARLEADGIHSLGPDPSGREGHQVPTPLERLRGKPVLAITTLADPRPVLSELTRVGARVDPLTFPDHHDFSEKDVAMILGRTRDRTVVMTRKEAVKLKGRLPSEIPAYVIELRVKIEKGEQGLINALLNALRDPA